MRIVAGEFRGRRIEAPKGSDTRPTTDRVREALFSTLVSLDAIVGARVLDAFAGSGALGLEALSRGAEGAVFVERDRAALKALQSNISTLGVSARARVIAGEAGRVCVRAAALGGPFSLLMLDPPYRIDPVEVSGLLSQLAASNALADGAIVTLEHASGVNPDWPEGFEMIARKKYGSTEIDIARYGEG